MRKGRVQRNWMWMIVGIEWLAIVAGVFVALVLLSGCRTTKYVPVESVRDRYNAIHTTDTLLIRDSVVIARSGDTIKEERWRDRWHKITLTDTLWQNDTIREPYAVEVPAKLTRWERLKIDYGGWGFAAILMIIVGVMYRKR